MVHVLSLSSRQVVFFLGIYKQEGVKVKQERCFYILSFLKFRVSSECSHGATLRKTNLTPNTVR